MPSPHRKSSASGVTGTGPHAGSPRWGPDKLRCLAHAAAALALARLAAAVAAYSLGYGLGGLASKWDASRILSVAATGYREPGDATIAPLLPGLIGLLARHGIEAWKAGLAVAWASSAALAIPLCSLYGAPGAVAVLLFPTVAVYTGIPYTEALALPLEALALLEALRDRPLRAAAALAVAGLARYDASLLSLALAIWYLANKRPVDSIAAAASAAPAALAAVLIGRHYYGDTLAYMHAEKAWEASLGVPFVSQARWLLDSWFARQEWRLGPLRFEPWMWVARNAAFYAVYAAGTVLLALRNRGLEAYWSLTAIILASSLVGIPGVSAPRLLLPAFPAIAVLAEEWRPGPAYVALAAAMTAWLSTWHLEAFFA